MRNQPLHWDETASESPFMTRKEAAAYLRCSVYTVDRRAVSNAWPYVMDGLRVLFYREDVVALPKAGFVRIRKPKPETLHFAQ